MLKNLCKKLHIINNCLFINIIFLIIVIGNSADSVRKHVYFTAQENEAFVHSVLNLFYFFFLTGNNRADESAIKVTD